MRCPFCGSTSNRVLDSRPSDDESTIRRRRMCVTCERRFTTFERIEEQALLVVKRNGMREAFAPGKLISGLEKACKNRPISPERIVRLAAEVETELRAVGAREVPSAQVGIALLNALRDLDEVAYVRFASVYKGFQDPADFERELESLRTLRKSTPPKQTPDQAPVQG